MAHSYGDERTNSGVDAHWRDFDFQNSQFGFNKDSTPRSWSQLIKECPSLETDLQIMLSRWARAQEDNGFTTIGIKITPPRPESYSEYSRL